MKFSQSAQEVIYQAHQLQTNTNKDMLCVEHILYGLLLMANYLDEPFNDMKYRDEAKNLRSYLKRNISSIASATYQIKKDAEDDSGAFFKTATPLLEAALRYSDGETIGVMDLAKATMDCDTPTLLAIRYLNVNGVAARDAKYGEYIEKPVTPANPEPAEDKRVFNSSTATKMLAFLALLAAAEERQQDQLRENSNIKIKKKKVKQKTKLGLFTYHGGTFAAAVQYYLFGLLIPFALMFGIEKLFGAFTAPANPFVAFLTYTFIILWAYYLLRGTGMLLGLLNNALGEFVQIFSTLALVGSFTFAIDKAWALPATPLWLKIISFLLAFLILFFGSALYAFLKSEEDITKTKIQVGNKKGTAGKLFFQYLTSQFLIPLIIFGIFWIFRIPLKPVVINIFYILGFIWVWSIIFNFFTYITIYNKVSKKRKFPGTVRFFYMLHLTLFAPELVMALHYIFNWFPMKTWVIVVLSIFSFLAFIVSLMSIPAAFLESSN